MQGGAGPTLTGGKRIVTNKTGRRWARPAPDRASQRFAALRSHSCFSAPSCGAMNLGEIKDSQRAAWCPTIEVFDENGQAAGRSRCSPGSRAAAVVLRCGCTSGSAARGCACTGDGAAVCWRAICGISSQLDDGAATAPVTTGHALAECAEDAGGLPIDRSRQRVAAAPAMV